MKVTILSLLALISVASAARMFWVGSDTDFANADNWSENEVPGNDVNRTSDPRIVSFTNEDGSDFEPVDSFVEEGAYSFGTIVFAQTGKVTLSPDGVTFILNQDADGADTYFTGGQDRSDPWSDFRCHKNWRKGADLNTAGETISPPCQSDEAVFTDDHSYRVYIHGRVNIDALVFGDTELESSSQIREGIPDHYMDITRGGDDLHIDDFSNCEETGAVDPDLADGTTCLCHSSCADEDTTLADNRQVRQAFRAHVNRFLGIEETLVQKYFSGTIDASSLGISTDLWSNFDANDIEAMIADFGAYFGGSFQGDVSFQDGVFTIQGTFTAPRSRFYTTNNDGEVWVNNGENCRLTDEATEAGETFPPENTWPFDQVANARVAHENLVCDMTADQFSPVFMHVVYNNIGRAIAGRHDSTIEEFGVNCGCGVEDGAIAAHMHNFASPTGFMQFVNEIALACPSENSDDDCPLNMIQAALEQGDPRIAVRSGNQQEIVMAMYNMLDALFSEATDEEVVAILQYLSNVAETIEGMWAQMAELNAARGYQWHEFSCADGSGLIVGENLPAEDVMRFLDDHNGLAVRQAIADSLRGYYGIHGVDEDSISLTVQNRQRRAVGSQHFCVNLRYSSMHEAISPGSTRHIRIQNRCNNILTAFELNSHHDCFSVTDGYDESCVRQQVSQAYIDAKERGASDAAALDAARSVLLTIRGCGLDGDCDSTTAEEQAAFDEDFLLYQSHAESDYTAHQAAISASASASDSEAGMPIPALGGAVVVVLIVIVLMRKRGNNSGGGNRKAERNVVAFENPLYEDAAAGAASEGLYDEPAFNADKQNPVYESAEDLTALATNDDDDGGYLDVAPEEEDE